MTKITNLCLAIAFSLFAFNAAYAQTNNSCRYGNTVAGELTGDNYLSNTLLPRGSDNSFTTTDPQLKELAAYLDTLNLPLFIVKAHIVLHKSMVLYEPEHTTHWGKPWYDHRGNLVNPNGDGNRLKQDFEANYRSVRIDMVDWWLNHAWGPYVLYENEEYGKNVVDVKVVLLNETNCWIDDLDVTFYKLPNADDPINIDNVDGGNEHQKIVLSSCCYDDNGKDEDRYFYIAGGGAPLYPERAKNLRFEWETQNKLGYSMLNGGNHGIHHKVLVGGEKLDYVTVVSYPHLREPIVALEAPKEQGKDYNLVVKLPKYFDGHRVATYVVIECVNKTTVNVRMVRGKVQMNFPIVVSRNPADADVGERWWEK